MHSKGGDPTQSTPLFGTIFAISVSSSFRLTLEAYRTQSTPITIRNATYDRVQSGEDGFVSLLECRQNSYVPSIRSLTVIEIAIATRNSNDISIYENCCSSRFEEWKLLHTLSGVLCNLEMSRVA